MKDSDKGRIWPNILIALIGCLGMIVAAVLAYYSGERAAVDREIEATLTAEAKAATPTAVAIVAENTPTPSVDADEVIAPPTIVEPITEAPAPTITPTPNVWEGVIDLDPRGLAIISGYELWFSSLAGNRWQLWHLDPDSRQFNRLNLQLSDSEKVLDQFVPALSPDGSKIAFLIGPCEEGGLCNRDLYVAEIDGSNPRPLSSDPCLDEFHPSWSPDGTMLTYFAGAWDEPACPNTPHGIWVVNAETGDKRQLTNEGDFDPVWSPNGQFIGYHSAVPSWSLKILDYTTCGETINSCESWVAADLGQISASVGWIDDFNIVFAANVDADWDIFSVPISNGEMLEPTKLTDNDFDDVSPSVVSNDGRILVWQAFPYYDEGGDVGEAVGRAAVLYVMDLTRKESAPVITGIGNARDAFVWSSAKG